MKALLIIDMQKISFTESTPRYKTKETVENINTLSHTFRLHGETVIFIQHDGSNEGICIPRTEEWEMLNELNIHKNDIIVSKIANDAFYQSDLQKILEELQITELIITGCATDFCVDATIKSAISRDYKTTVISDAHTTADRLGMKAKSVIEYFNWLWTEMIPTQHAISGLSTMEYLKQFQSR